MATGGQAEAELVALGQRLRSLREACQMTQHDLAEAATLHWTYVGQMERGRRNPSYLVLVRLAKALGQPIEALFTEG